MGSSGIRNVLLKSERRLQQLFDNCSTQIRERKIRKTEGFNNPQQLRVHPVFEMFYSNQREKTTEDRRLQQSGLVYRQCQQLRVHPVFEMFYSNQREKTTEHRRLQQSGLVYRQCRQLGFHLVFELFYSNQRENAEFSHLIVLCIRCSVTAKNTSVDSVNKHSIKCIACFDLCINSVDKQDTLLNTQ